MKGFMPISDKFETKRRYEPLKTEKKVMKVTITIGLKKMNWVQT